LFKSALQHHKKKYPLPKLGRGLTDIVYFLAPQKYEYLIYNNINTYLKYFNIIYLDYNIEVIVYSLTVGKYSSFVFEKSAYKIKFSRIKRLLSKKLYFCPDNC